MGTAVPILRYRNVRDAVKWATRVLQLQFKTSDPGTDGPVSYVEMRFGSSLIIFSEVGETDLDKHLKQPDEIGGVVTQSCYLSVDDIEAHFNAAKAQGADIVLGLETYKDGGKGYACRDPEGHLWCFGTYDPWAGVSDRVAPMLQARLDVAPPKKPVLHDPDPMRAPWFYALVASTAFIAGAGAGHFGRPPMERRPPVETAAIIVSEEASTNQRSAAGATRPAKLHDGPGWALALKSRGALLRERQDRATAEARARDADTALSEAREKLAAAQSEKAVIEEKLSALAVEFQKEQFGADSDRSKTAEVRAQFEAAERERSAARDAAEVARRELAEERQARATAESAAAQAAAALATERTGRDASDKTARDLESRLQAAESGRTEANEALAAARAAKDASETSLHDLENRLRAAEASAADTNALREELAHERQLREDVEKIASGNKSASERAAAAVSETSDLSQELARQRARLELAEQKSSELQAKVSDLEAAAAERDKLRSELESARSAKENAEKAATEAARAERAAADGDAQKLREEIARERGLRETAEKAAADSQVSLQKGKASAAAAAKKLYLERQLRERAEAAAAAAQKQAERDRRSKDYAWGLLSQVKGGKAQRPTGKAKNPQSDMEAASGGGVEDQQSEKPSGKSPGNAEDAPVTWPVSPY